MQLVSAKNARLCYQLCYALGQSGRLQNMDLHGVLLGENPAADSIFISDSRDYSTALSCADDKICVQTHLFKLSSEVGA